MPNSLRCLLETKMPAPLATIVIDYLQDSIETQRERHKQVLKGVRVLDWLGEIWDLEVAGQDTGQEEVWIAYGERKPAWRVVLALHRRSPPRPPGRARPAP
jgi:hypothetical protein